MGNYKAGMIMQTYTFKNNHCLLAGVIESQNRYSLDIQRFTIVYYKLL